jgi:DNA mismatch repair protein MutS2
VYVNLRTFDEILEFSEVLQILRSFLKTFSARDFSSNLPVLTDKNRILYEYQITGELLEFIKYEGQIHFYEAGDIRESLKKAKIEGFYLSADEILEIFRYLLIYKDIYEAISSPECKEKYPLLSEFIQSVNFCQDLYKKIDGVFDENGNIKDTASEELYRIRKRKTSVREEVYKIANRIFSDPYLGECFQERNVTFKDGRFVIPVKTSFKSKVKDYTDGIIHSFSNTRETVYVEPEVLMRLNEEIFDLEEKEAIEVEKILTSITKEINTHSEELYKIYNNVGRLEWIYAKAQFANKYRCEFPEICEEKLVILFEARHPLLFNNAVPVDIEVGKNFSGLIVSGPNAGGKTVLIKTVGLLTRMALSGIPIPASKRSKIGMFEKIMAEIGDEQSISNNLSSFSGHILAISKILNEADENSLVLIDEIASSTEPREGEALAIAIVEELLAKKARFIITTHYQALKKFALLNSQLENAAMEFDEENFKPLFKVKTGIYGKSYALEIAKNFNLKESIINRAQFYLSSKSDEADKKLDEFEKLSRKLIAKKEIIEKNLREAKQIKSYYERLKEELELQKLNLKNELFAQLKKEYEDVLFELSKLKEKLRAKKIEDKKELDNQLKKVEEFIDRKEKETIKLEKIKDFNPGEKVYIPKFNKHGYIEAISEDKVKVRMGLINLFVNKDEVYKPEGNEKESIYTRTQYEIKNLPFTLDVRGLRASEALKVVEKAIDNAIINGNDCIYIIHGKGEGILKKMLWDYLKTLKEVKSFEFAKPEEGGQGKTIVFLR